MSFIEERILVNVDYGAAYGERYKVEIQETKSGNEYRRLIDSTPRFIYEISYNRVTSTILENILDLYHRCYGMFAGFRAKNINDYTSNGWTTAPTNTDQTCEYVADNSFQLVKFYGDSGKDTLSIGRPKRTIYKPVSGTVVAKAGGYAIPTAKLTVDTTTGLISANVGATYSDEVTAITRANPCVLTVANTTNLAVGESVFLYGIDGMTEIDLTRHEVTAKTATTITLDLDSTSYSAFSAGGSPISGVTNIFHAEETVTAGFEFDIPVRFDSDLDQMTIDNFDNLLTGGIMLKEILNPLD